MPLCKGVAVVGLCNLADHGLGESPAAVPGSSTDSGMGFSAALMCGTLTCMLQLDCSQLRNPSA
jgi:hypothetical protein